VRVLRDPKSFVVAPERVRAIFDVDKCAAEYEALFRELATRRTRAAA